LPVPRTRKKPAAASDTSDRPATLVTHAVPLLTPQHLFGLVEISGTLIGEATGSAHLSKHSQFL